MGRVGNGLGRACREVEAEPGVIQCLHEPSSPPFPLQATLLRRCPCRYDGQIFVKPPEVLARDRLLGMYVRVIGVRACRRGCTGAGEVWEVQGSLKQHHRPP